MQGGWIVAAVLALTAPAEASTSSNDDFRSQIERLLTLAAEPSARNLVAIQRFYQALPSERRNDRRMKQAYAVALIQQKQFHQASKLLHELADEQPADAGRWRTKVWLALTLGERVRALTEIEQLAGQAAAHRSSQEEPLSDIETAEFLGAVCGFFAGPWSDKVRAADAQQIEDRLRGAFDAKSQAAFDESKAQVAERYVELREQHEKQAEQAQAAANQKRDKARKSLSDAAQALGDKQQALKDKEAKRTGDAKSKVADIEKERKSIDQKRQSLMQQIAPLETARLALVSQLLPEPLPLQPLTVPQASLAQANIQHNRVIRVSLAPLVAKLTELETKVMLLNEREFELLADQAATGMKYQEDLGKLAQQTEALKTDRNRLKYDAKRLKSKSAAGSPRLRAEAEQLTRFNTYLPFGFEREKEQLLKEVR